MAAVSVVQGGVEILKVLLALVGVVLGQVTAGVVGGVHGQRRRVGEPGIGIVDADQLLDRVLQHPDLFLEPGDVSRQTFNVWLLVIPTAIDSAKRRKKSYLIYFALNPCYVFPPDSSRMLPYFSYITV